MKFEIKTSKSYSPIFVENGNIANLGKIAAERVKGRRAVVVSDSNVGNLHLQSALTSLREAGFWADSICVPAGESSKSLEMLSVLWNTFNGYEITRTDVVVALGGGVVGDLTGFASATYLRGCAVIQVPTSLLAQVDSSIGGKTGIDLPFGKNLAGAFHQPVAVVTDPELLKTLPKKIFSEGMAEIIKYGCIKSRDLFEKIESDDISTEGMVAESVRIKTEVVTADEFDMGERMTLNFGHTIGHAIERIMGYGFISHGEAVGIGMVYASRIGEHLGLTEVGTTERIINLLKKFDLPTDTDFSFAEVFEGLLSDKKKLGKKFNFIIIKKIGEAMILPLTKEELHDHLKAVFIK